MTTTTTPVEPVTPYLCGYLAALRHAADQPADQLGDWLAAQLAAMERQAELERRDLAPLLDGAP